MNVLILYAKSTFEVRNRKSALGAYIHCLANLLSNEHSIFVNGIHISEIKQESPALSSGKKGSGFSSYIPAFVKNIRRDNILFAGHHKLADELSASSARFDIIIEFYSYGSAVGTTLKKKWHIPLISVIDAPVIDEFEHFHGKKYVNRTKIIRNENATINLSDAVIAYSNPMKDYVLSRCSRPVAVYVHQNIDFSRFETCTTNKPVSPVNICFIGSFLKWHKVDFLLDGFEEVCKKTKAELRLYLVGEGMEYENVKKYAAGLPCASRIIFTGYKDGVTLQELKCNMHIGIMPGSNWYGIPNKLFEYLAADMLVLAPATPSIYDVFANHGVELFKTGDAADFENKLEHMVLEYETLYEKNKPRVREFIGKYTSEHTKTLYLDLIKKATNTK
ncbi:MAG: glycosyltransferase family 4 protein [Flavobacteriales bacterium]